MNRQAGSSSWHPTKITEITLKSMYILKMLAPAAPSSTNILATDVAAVLGPCQFLLALLNPIGIVDIMGELRQRLALYDGYGAPPFEPIYPV